jgi:hypothetical protein
MRSEMLHRKEPPSRAATMLPGVAPMLLLFAQVNRKKSGRFALYADRRLRDRLSDRLGRF